MLYVKHKGLKDELRSLFIVIVIMAQVGDKLPSLDDDIDTMIDSKLEAFQDGKTTVGNVAR